MTCSKAVSSKSIDAVERRRRGEQAQMVAALGEQPVERELVEAIGREHRVGDALRRILVEVEAGRAEGRSRSAITVVGAARLREIAQATLWAMVEEPTPPLAPMKAIGRPIGSAPGSR